MQLSHLNTALFFTEYGAFIFYLCIYYYFEWDVALEVGVRGPIAGRVEFDVMGAN